jgi:hypothetical protein
VTVVLFDSKPASAPPVPVTALTWSAVRSEQA